MNGTNLVHYSYIIIVINVPIFVLILTRVYLQESETL